MPRLRRPFRWDAVATYADRALSGAHTAERHGYQRMLKDAEEQGFDAIVAEDIDRFTRDMEESAAPAQAHGFLVIEIHVANERRVGKLAGAFKGMMSDLYLDQLAEQDPPRHDRAFDRGGTPWWSLFRLCQRLGARPAGDR